jgi:hypothetical protein
LVFCCFCFAALAAFGAQDGLNWGSEHSGLLFYRAAVCEVVCADRDCAPL